jgi:GNAT superfamily N-acetyltransferase
MIATIGVSGHTDGMTASADPEFEVRYGLEPERIAQLLDLYAGEWWTATRTAADVERMLTASDVVVALVSRADDRLVAFARALTDDAYVALVLDVIVAADRRREGLGATLMDAILRHPRLAGVASVELTCREGLVAFYRRFGFTDQVGGSRLMRRTSDPRLTGLA